jgi:hypothetical protein
MFLFIDIYVTSEVGIVLLGCKAFGSVRYDDINIYLSLREFHLSSLRSTFFYKCCLNSMRQVLNVGLLICLPVALGVLMVSVFAIGPKVRGLKHDRGQWIFNGDKIPQHDFLRRGRKAVGPMS